MFMEMIQRAKQALNLRPSCVLYTIRVAYKTLLNFLFAQRTIRYVLFKL